MSDKHVKMVSPTKLTNVTNTVQEAWDNYERHVVPKGAGDAQRVETRRAFYAGALSVINIMVGISRPDTSEDAGAAIFEGIRQECINFYQVQLAKDLARIQATQEGDA